MDEKGCLLGFQKKSKVPLTLLVDGVVSSHPASAVVVESNVFTSTSAFHPETSGSCDPKLTLASTPEYALDIVLAPQIRG
jgi:hypothetical protein